MDIVLAVYFVLPAIYLIYSSSSPIYRLFGSVLYWVLLRWLFVSCVVVN